MRIAQIASPYGTFPGQVLLGEPATLRYERIEDHDQRARGIFGDPLYRGELAIHVSGRDEFGGKTDAGVVREIAWSTTEFLRPGVSMGGADPHAVVIFSSGPGQDSDWSTPLHIARWSPADSFVTWDGVATEFTGYGPFRPQAVIDRLNERNKARGRTWDFSGPWHLGAVRRLLDLAYSTHLRARAKGTPVSPRCERRGRWGYEVRRRES